jgi:hypothetical protein
VQYITLNKQFCCNHSQAKAPCKRELKQRDIVVVR